MAAKKTKKKTITKARKPRQIRVTGGAEASTAPSAEGRKRGTLQKLSIEELRAKYKDVIGRETESDNKAYLVWKIREAQNGRIRIGPRLTREPKGPQAVLSVRVDEDVVDLLDAAWRKHGAHSRNDFVLRALGRELRELGEREAAARFPTSEA